MAVSVSESLNQKITIQFQSLPAVTALRGEYNFRGYQAGFNRRPNSLSALRVGESGGVSDQENALARNLPRGAPVESIRVPNQRGSNVRRKPAGRQQIPHKLGRM